MSSEEENINVEQADAQIAMKNAEGNCVVPLNGLRLP